jgi:hypothetical protein
VGHQHQGEMDNDITLAITWKEDLIRLLSHGSKYEEELIKMIYDHPNILAQPVEMTFPMNKLPLHLECKYLGRSAIISICIELYPEALARVDDQGDMPLHLILKIGIDHPRLMMR